MKIAGLGRDKLVEKPVEILSLELFHSYLTKILPCVNERFSFLAVFAAFEGVRHAKIFWDLISKNRRKKRNTKKTF